MVTKQQSLYEHLQPSHFFEYVKTKMSNKHKVRAGRKTLGMGSQHFAESNMICQCLLLWHALMASICLYRMPRGCPAHSQNRVTASDLLWSFLGMFACVYALGALALHVRELPGVWAY